MANDDGGNGHETRGKWEKRTGNDGGKQLGEGNGNKERRAEGVARRKMSEKCSPQICHAAQPIPAKESATED